MDLRSRVRPARSWARACATVLLVLQASANGAAALPHPGETRSGPPVLESHHSAQCVTLHDAARCAQCQYAATRSLPTAERRVSLTAAADRRRPGCGPTLPAFVRLRDRATPSRAPPLPL
jgi:hypothetical protein